MKLIMTLCLLIIIVNLSMNSNFHVWVCKANHKFILFCLYFVFKALADKLRLGQENFLNFALFEILEDGFGEWLMLHPTLVSLNVIQ